MSRPRIAGDPAGPFTPADARALGEFLLRYAAARGEKGPGPESGEGT